MSISRPELQVRGTNGPVGVDGNRGETFINERTQEPIEMSDTQTKPDPVPEPKPVETPAPVEKPKELEFGERIGTKPSVAEPSVAEPRGTKPSGTEPSVSEPSLLEPEPSLPEPEPSLPEPEPLDIPDFDF